MQYALFFKTQNSIKNSIWKGQRMSGQLVEKRFAYNTFVFPFQYGTLKIRKTCISMNKHVSHALTEHLSKLAGWCIKERTINLVF